MPNFFCGLGFPKTGTTWLASYLRDHPNVYLPLMKELQVFNRRFRPDLYSWIDQTINHNLTRTSENLISSSCNKEKLAELTGLMAEALALPHHANTDYMMRAYRRLFTGRITSEHHTFGEFSTSYCVLPEEGLRFLDSAFPNTRYIIMLRDPVERFWSHVKHQVRFRDGFNPVTAYSEMFDDQELSEMANYRTVIRNISAVIPSHRVHFAFYESLFTLRDSSALRAITDFLEVSYIPADVSNVVYGGESVAMPDSYRAEALNRFQDSYAFVTELFGEMPKGWTTES